MSDSLIWTLLGHLVCIAQWAAFILVDYAYLGRGRRRTFRPRWNSSAQKPSWSPTRHSAA